MNAIADADLRPAQRVLALIRAYRTDGDRAHLHTVAANLRTIPGRKGTRRDTARLTAVDVVLGTDLTATEKALALGLDPVDIELAETVNAGVDIVRDQMRAAMAHHETSAAAGPTTESPAVAAAPRNAR